VADQDPKTPAKADLARVPGLLDQYRQHRRAWLAQADELVRMRDEVRHAAEREAIEIVTAARRDVRRIIVEARRELLVLTAQLHAAVEATDAPGLEAPPFTALLDDPDARSRVESASHGTDITRDVVHEARKGVRSVLDEARAEIEALSADAPAVFGHGSGPHDGPAAGGATEADEAEASPALDDEPRAQDSTNEAAGRPLGEACPVHELTVDAALAALDFQTRDLPIPTLARLLGTEPAHESPRPAGDRVASTGGVFEPLMAFETPRLSELRSLLRDRVEPHEPAPSPTPAPGHPVLSPDVEPVATSPFAFDTAPKTDFFGDHRTHDAPLEEDAPASDGDLIEVSEPPLFTPPSRLFGEDDTRSSARSARTFVGLFAATGALAVIGTIWWALSRDSAPLSAATPPVITEKTTATAPASTAPPVVSSAPGTLALTIEARRPSWIRAQIDGKDETGRIYQAGETRHIYGARTVSIRAGDAGAVFVGLDGGTAKALGADGAAATKQFSATVTPAVATAGDRPSLTTATAPVPAAASPASARTAVAEVPAPTLRAPAPTAPAQPSASAPRAATDTPAALRDGVSGGRPDLVQAAQQWLDAYQRRDRDVMSAMGIENVTVSDERSVTERFPAWQGGVQRNLDEVALELTGDVAVFTARMTEHAESGAGEHVSRVSQFWQRRSGRWYVTNVRIIGEARLNQIIR
jgi:ketosteroid isomerase-like protein